MTKKQKYFYTYKITHISSNRFYYGQRSTTKTDDSAYMGSGTIIKSLVKKYGRNSFLKEILGYYPDADALNAAEAELITEETLKDPLCVNLKTGGDCGRPSDETRAKISEANRNRSPETRAKLSEANRNRSPETRAEAARNMSEESRAKISEANRGRKRSPETRAKIAEAARNRPPASAETRAKISASRKAACARRKEKAAAAA